MRTSSATWIILVLLLLIEPIEPIAPSYSLRATISTIYRPSARVHSIISSSLALGSG